MERGSKLTKIGLPDFLEIEVMVKQRGLNMVKIELHWQLGRCRFDAHDDRDQNHNPRDFHHLISSISVGLACLTLRPHRPANQMLQTFPDYHFMGGCQQQRLRDLVPVHRLEVQVLRHGERVIVLRRGERVIVLRRGENTS